MSGKILTIKQQAQQTKTLLRYFGPNYKRVLSSFVQFRASLAKIDQLGLLRELSIPPSPSTQEQLEELWLSARLPHFDEKKVDVWMLPLDQSSQLRTQIKLLLQKPTKLLTRTIAEGS